MKIGAIIFARYSSSRLPGKAMIDIGGRSMLGRVIDRSRRISGIEKVVIATSSDPSDDVIAAFAEEERIYCYRGDLDNVAARAVGACEDFDFDAFVRICGDRPFFDSDICSGLIKLFEARDLDLATTVGGSPVPPGLTAEIMRLSTLRKHLPSLSAYDQEHVTSFFYRTAGTFRIKTIPAPDYLTPQTKVRLVVDDETDLARARTIASAVPGDSSDMSKIISSAEQWDRDHGVTLA